MTRTAAIGATELRENDTLIGDSICPTRHNTGQTVNAVNLDMTEDGVVLAIVGGANVEFNAHETLYVTRPA